MGGRRRHGLLTASGLGALAPALLWASLAALACTSESDGPFAEDQLVADPYCAHAPSCSSPLRSDPEDPRGFFAWLYQPHAAAFWHLETALGWFDAWCGGGFCGWVARHEGCWELIMADDVPYLKLWYDEGGRLRAVSWVDDFWPCCEGGVRKHVYTQGTVPPGCGAVVKDKWDVDPESPP